MASTCKSAEAGDGRPEAGARAGLRPGRSSRPYGPPLPGRRRRRGPDPLGGRASLPAPDLGAGSGRTLAARGCQGLAGAGRKSCPPLGGVGALEGESPGTPGAGDDAHPGARARPGRGVPRDRSRAA